jgi:hypothetical protein
VPVPRRSDHQEVRTNRRDFPGSEIARHFRSLCAENRSLRLVWHVQATFLGVTLPKSLAANFRFQSCIAPRVGAARSQVATRGKHRREESPSLAGLTTRKRGWLALSPLAPLGVVGFIFFRRQLLKISWAHLLAIFVENANVWRRLIYNGHSLESQLSAVVALHNLLSGLS